MSMCSIARASLHRMCSLHGDGDFLGMQRRIERLVQVIGKYQFEGVLARRQCQRSLGLTLAEMQYFVRSRHGDVEVYFTQMGVHQKMMVPGVVEFDSRRRNSHALQSKADGKGTVHFGAIVRRDEIHLRTRD